MTSVLLLAAALSSARANPADTPWVDDVDVDPLALVDALEAHLSPGADAVPEHAPHGPSCLTPLVWQLRTHFDELSQADQERVHRLIGPLRSFDAGNRPVPSAAPPASGEPCSDEYRGSNSVKGEKFWIEWDGSTLSQSQAETFLSYFEESWQIEIEDLGWRDPDNTNRYPIAVYVYNYSGWAGAVTSVDNCSGGGYTPFIVVGSGSFSTGSWLKTLAAHEFNHASQFAYGQSHEFWWWEATATYVEESVFPENNDWADNVYYYSNYPYVGMNAFDQNDDLLFWHTYAMSIWGFHLDNHYGGPEAVVESWQRSLTHGSAYDYWMPDNVDDMGLDFDEVYASFLASNTVMDYDESRYFYAIDLEDSFSSLPATGEPSRSSTPQSLGANFYKIDEKAFDDGEALEVTFSGDDSVDWYVVLVRASGTTVDAWERVEVDNGEGVGTLDWESGEDMYVVVSPMDDDAQGYYYSWASADDFDYSFDADIAGASSGDGGAAGDGGGDGGDAPSRPDGNADEDDSLACGCAAAPTGGLGLAWAVGLLALARRRRD